jgi:hypothetical protein
MALTYRTTDYGGANVPLTNLQIDENFKWLADNRLSILGGSITGDLQITGNITVTGTTTTINSTSISVDDKNIELGAVDTPTDVTADGGGLTLKGATDKTFAWTSTGANWNSSENISVVAGKSYKIANVAVLSASTLGASVVNSSLTSVGALATGTWQASTIAAIYGGTGQSGYATGDILYASSSSALAKLAKGTDGQVLKLVSGLPAWAADTVTTISDDTTTATTYYPTFATATSGNMSAVKVASTKLTFNPSTGSLSATNFDSLSDVRFKRDLIKIEGALSKVKQLTGYTYYVDGVEKRQAGLLSQDMLKVQPELVGGDVEKLTIMYGNSIALLVEAVKEIDDKLEEIRNLLVNK